MHPGDVHGADLSLLAVGIVLCMRGVTSGECVVTKDMDSGPNCGKSQGSVNRMTGIDEEAVLILVNFGRPGSADQPVGHAHDRQHEPDEYLVLSKHQRLSS